MKFEALLLGLVLLFSSQFGSASELGPAVAKSRLFSVTVPTGWNYENRVGTELRPLQQRNGKVLKSTHGEIVMMPTADGIHSHTFVTIRDVVPTISLDQVYQIHQKTGAKLSSGTWGGKKWQIVDYTDREGRKARWAATHQGDADVLIMTFVRAGSENQYRAVIGSIMESVVLQPK